MTFWISLLATAFVLHATSYTKTYAMAAAAGLSVTLIPVLMAAFIPGKIADESANPLNRVLIALYRPIIDKVLKFPRATLALAAFAASTCSRAASSALSERISGGRYIEVAWESRTCSARIAAPMIGGMVTAPLLSMVVLPAAYLLLKRRAVVRETD